MFLVNVYKITVRPLLEYANTIWAQWRV